MIHVDLTLLGLLKGNFFNFLILFALIVFAFVKLRVKDKLESAKEDVKHSMELSEEAKIQSEKTLETVKQEVENLDEEIAQIDKNAQHTVDAFKKTSAAQIQQSIEHLENNAKKIVESEEQKISATLTKELAKKAVDNAYDKTVQNLKENNDLHRKYIAEAIEQIDRVNI